MRKLLAALLLFGLGIGGAVIVAKPASAHTAVLGTLVGTVGSAGTPNQSVITLTQNGSTVTNLPTAGTYEFDITDYATTHNFDICAGASRCTSGTSIDMTDIVGTSSGTVWDITLSDGEYTYQCDAHTSMTKHFTVGASTTTSTTTTTGTTTTQTTATTTSSSTTSQTTTTTPTTTTTTGTTTSQTTTTTPTTTTQQTTTTSSGGGTPLTVHIVSAKGTTHSVVVKVSSSKHGKAVAQLLKGSKRLAKSSHTVPGKITLKPSRALKPGRYTVTVAVTAGGKHATVKKTVKIT